MSDPRWIGARYELLEQLGGCADGSLWRGWDLASGADCVARLVQLDSTGTGLSAAARWNQLVRTLDAVGRLNHPGLVAVDDIVADDGRWVLITRFVPGESLETKLATSGVLPAAEAVRIVAQACDALAAAHEAGLVHGRVKPSNLLLEPAEDGKLNVRLTDFGLAALESWAAHHTAPDPAVIAARALYRPPEWIPGMPTTSAGDVYAAGVLLYEALTGNSLADKANPSRPHDASAVAATTATDAFRTLLAQCLEGRPRLRPTAAQMAHRLRGTTPGPRLPIPHAGSAAVRGGAHARHAPDVALPAKQPGRHRDSKTLRRVEVAASATAVVLVGGLTFTLGEGRGSVPPGVAPTHITITQSAISAVGHTQSASAPSSASSASPGADATGSGGSGPSSSASTGPGATTGSGSPTASSPAGLPGSAPSASPESAPSTPANSPRGGLPVSDPIGYLEQLRAMIQLMASEGPSVIDANAAGDVENLVLDLENGVNSYQQNGGDALLQMIKNKISDFDQRLAQDQIRGLIAPGAADQLAAFLQKLSPG